MTWQGRCARQVSPLHFMQLQPCSFQSFSKSDAFFTLTLYSTSKKLYLIRKANNSTLKKNKRTPTYTSSLAFSSVARSSWVLNDVSAGLPCFFSNAAKHLTIPSFSVSETSNCCCKFNSWDRKWRVSEIWLPNAASLVACVHKVAPIKPNQLLVTSNVRMYICVVHLFLCNFTSQLLNYSWMVTFHQGQLLTQLDISKSKTALYYEYCQYTFNW